MIVETMTDLIGNTPLLKLDPSVTGLKNIDLYAKLEMMNPFGSVKDRTAWALVRDELPELKKTKKTIYENSSGNTAKSLQAIAGIHGLKFKLISSRARVPEFKEVLQLQGADIVEVAGAADCYDPTDPNDPQVLIERTAKAQPGEIFFTNQYTNAKNPRYHEDTTAQEIIDDLGSVDYVVGGLGTTGSSLGIIRKLRERNPDCVSLGVVSNTNDFIPGIRNLSELWEVGLFDKNYYNDIMTLTSMQALQGVLTLNRQCGVLCGPSSGANFTAALEYLKTIDVSLTERKKAVFVVCDRVEWYVSYIRARMPEIFGEEEKENSLHRFSSDASASVVGIQPDHFETWCAENPNAVIIDLRTPDSFQMVSMPGSINMPVDLFEKWIDNHNPFPSGTRVLLICAVGERSRHYAAYLKHLGCDSFNLEGGILSWNDTCRMAA